MFLYRIFRTYNLLLAFVPYVNWSRLILIENLNSSILMTATFGLYRIGWCDRGMVTTVGRTRNSYIECGSSGEKYVPRVILFISTFYLFVRRQFFFFLLLLSTRRRELFSRIFFDRRTIFNLRVFGPL